MGSLNRDQNIGSFLMEFQKTDLTRSISRLWSTASTRVTNPRIRLAESKRDPALCIGADEPQWRGQTGVATEAR